MTGPIPAVDHVAPGGTNRRLLIIGGSPNTRHHPAPMPALQRYDSPEFRALRAWPADQLVGTQIMTLSAGYGLRLAEDEILDDRSHMSRERAGELVPRVTAALYIWLKGNPTCRTVCVCANRSAFYALPGFDAWCARHQIAYTEITGPLNARLRRLKTWLAAQE